MEDGGCVGLDLGGERGRRVNCMRRGEWRLWGYIRCEATSGGVGNEVRVMTLGV